MHWVRNSFELVQLRQILEASCGYAMDFGLVRQERDWKINKHDMFYEHLKRFSVWGPCDNRKALRGFIPCRPATSKATRGCIPCRLVAGRSPGVFIPCRLASMKATRGFIPCRLVSRKATRGWFPCRHGTSKVTRCQVLKIKFSYMFHIVLLFYAIVWDKFSL